MDELILEAKQITVDWLSHILKTRGYLEDGNVLNIKNIKEIKRYVSKSYFFDVEYSKQTNHALSKNFFLKVYDSGLDKELMGIKEVEFYKIFPAVMNDFTFIDCYAHEYGQDKSSAYLLFRDVSEEIVLPQKMNVKNEPVEWQLKKVIRYLAEFHAYWWDSPDLGHGIGEYPDKSSYEQYIQRNEKRYVYLKNIMKHKLPDDRKKIFEKILARWEIMFNRLNSKKNLTICHGDANIYNILWPGTRDGKFYFIDWNYWQIHIGAHDIAYLLSLTLHPEIREKLEKDLIRFYYDCLLEKGIKDYSWEDYWFDYRLSLAMVLFTPAALCEWGLPFFAWWGQYLNSFKSFDRFQYIDILG